MVDHFHARVAALGKIGGNARAMVVTSGIERAIQYFHAFKADLAEIKSPYQAIVAFSGEHEYGGATGAAGTVREYIYLPEAEIAPAMHSRTRVDRPIAVVDCVNGATPVTYHVHVDHLNRPIRMTNAAKASVWDATWLPWGGEHAITGTAALILRPAMKHSMLI